MSEEKVHTEEFRVNGEELLGKIKQLVKEGNIRRIIIKNKEGKVVFEIPLTFGVVGALIAPQLAFYDLNVRLFGPDAWLAAGSMRAEGTESLNGAVIATGFWPDNPDPATKTFVQKFETAYGVTPSALAAQAYDTLQLVTLVLRDLPRGAGREEMAARLLQVKGFSSMTGEAWAEPNGEIRRAPLILRDENGQWQRLK